MYWIKKPILASFQLVVATLSRLVLGAIVLVLAGEGIADLKHVERYALLNNILVIERYVEQPVNDYLHANIPCSVAGVDVAPYLLVLALLGLWTAAESERFRLTLLSWDLEIERRMAVQRRIARRESRRDAARAAEIARLHARDEAAVRAASRDRSDETAVAA
jgi:hypothetical protein